MRTFILAILVAFAAPAAAGDWTKADTAWQATYTGLLILDCAQTRYGASHPEQFEERNPLMGKHPSKGRINTICALTGIGHYGISQWLSPKWRRLWQQSTSFIEIGIVMRNHDEGSKFEFKMGWRFR